MFLSWGRVRQNVCGRRKKGGKDRIGVWENEDVFGGICLDSPLVEEAAGWRILEDAVVVVAVVASSVLFSSGVVARVSGEIVVAGIQDEEEDTSLKALLSACCLCCRCLKKSPSCRTCWWYSR